MPRNSNPLYGKILIAGSVHCETGLHIGAGRERLEIGGVDLPIIRDPVSGVPYLPGSSLRGRLRSLFERRTEALNRNDIYSSASTVEDASNAIKEFEKNFYRKLATVGGKPIRIHLCPKDDCPICRIFGSVGMKTGEPNVPARLRVPDLPLRNLRYLRDKTGSDEHYTELKWENVLDRVTAHANPREVERVPRGAEFSMLLVYDVTSDLLEEARADVQALFALLRLLQDASLGGNSSRGYGQVSLWISDIICRSNRYYDAHDETERTSYQTTLSMPETVSRDSQGEGQHEPGAGEPTEWRVDWVEPEKLNEWLEQALSTCQLQGPAEEASDTDGGADNGNGDPATSDG